MGWRSDAVSGVYIARPTRTTSAAISPAIFRSSSGTITQPSDLLFQSDTTWQAYNGYGGYSVYASSGHAHKVSYNRPFTTRYAPAED